MRGNPEAFVDNEDDAATMTESEQKGDENRSRSSFFRCTFCEGLLPKGEVLGICCVFVSVGAAFIANVFLSTALLHLARIDAGCMTPGPCGNRVHGMLPSALLTNLAAIGGLIVAVTLPIIGSIVDYTAYRRQIGFTTGAVFVALNASQIALSLSTWFAMAIIQIFAAFVFFVNVVVSEAYIPDLSSDVEKQNGFNSMFVSLRFACMFVFAIVVIVLSLILNADDVVTARIGQVLVVVVYSLTQGFAWMRLIKDRPAIDEVPEGSSLIFAGFRKVYYTSRQVCARYRALMWFLVSSMFIGGGQSGLATTIITVAKVILGMSATLVGVMILTICLMGSVGGAVSHFVTKRLDPIRSLKLSLVLLVATTSTASAVLKSPDQKLYSFIFAALWGIGGGWSLSAERTCFVMIIPSGASAELYGTWHFLSAVLSWLPPLIFSFLIESGVSMQWGLASIGFFLVLGLICLFPMGGFDHAVDQVMEKEDDRSSVETRKRRSNIALLPHALSDEPS